MSARIELVHLLEVVKGKLLRGEAKGVLDGAATDSRAVEPGNIFFARKGEDSDGHLYLDAASLAKAGALLVSENWDGLGSWLQSSQKTTLAPVISVDSPDRALSDLAAWWRKQLDCPVIAITGSNGKTTTKEMLAGVLEHAVGEGCSNLKSYNNHVGVPLTILSCAKDSAWLVLEMGMNHRGELKQLSLIARPDVAVILNVAPAHIGFFKGLSDIAAAKSEIFSGLVEDGIAVLPAFDKEVLSAVEKLEHLNLNKIYFGPKNANISFSDLKNRGLSGLSFTVHREEEIAELEIEHLGNHNAFNAVAAIAAAISAFPQLKLKDLARGLETSRAASMRLEVIRLASVDILNDCYNANPKSYEASIEFAASLQAPLIFIFADMAELGEAAADYHFRLGLMAKQASPVVLIAAGTFAAKVIEGAEGCSGELIKAKNLAAISKIVLDWLEKHSERPVVLIKGSRAAKLELVVQELRETLAS